MLYTFGSACVLSLCPFYPPPLSHAASHAETTGLLSASSVACSRPSPAAHPPLPFSCRQPIRRKQCH